MPELPKFSVGMTTDVDGPTTVKATMTLRRRGTIAQSYEMLKLRLAELGFDPDSMPDMTTFTSIWGVPVMRIDIERTVDDIASALLLIDDMVNAIVDWSDDQNFTADNAAWAER